jgi:hypothetical protein
MGRLGCVRRQTRLLKPSPNAPFAAKVQISILLAAAPGKSTRPRAAYLSPAGFVYRCGTRQELAMPPAITAEMAKGFTLYMTKAILSGRGDEIVELARTNLRR